MKLRSNARTDVGKARDHNEDTFGIGEGEVVERLGELFVVCDGMGGHAAGEVASQLAVAAILDAYYADDNDDRPQALERAFIIANKQVYKQGRGTMGTTGVAAVLHHDALHVANVGDSRAYLIRDGTIRQISRDHSFVGDQLAAGLITAEEARVSAHRNIITRALGHQADITVDMFRWPLQVGDDVLLCSDGLHGLIADEELLRLVTATPLQDIADVLVDLANERGGHDNITVVLAHVDALDWYSSQPADDGASADTAPLEVATSAVTQQITDRLATPAASEAPQAEHAASAAPRSPDERRLSLLGGLLSALLLVTLLAAILFVYLVPPQAPAAAPTFAPVSTVAPSQPSASPAATAAPTSPAEATPEPSAAPAT